MSDLVRWMVDAARKNWQSLSGGQPAPTFMDLPEDVFLNICEWLSVRDILALRMVNKGIARVTLQSNIWFSLLRKLKIPLPILPATAQYRFGEVKPQTYEWLITRALYLEQNWRRQNPVASHSRFEAYGRTIAMKLLPGGKYLVTVCKNMQTVQYSLVVWDLDHAGKRVALSSVSSSTPFLRLDAKYANFGGSMCIAIAFSKPPVPNANGKSTQICVVTVPLRALEDLARRDANSPLMLSIIKPIEFPFGVVHASSTNCEVGQLALGDFNGQLVLVVVHRPRALVFYYIESGQRGNLLLGSIHPYDGLRHSIWSVKLLTGQNSVLVGRVLVEAGAPMDSTLFTLDMFLLPGPGSTYKDPSCISRQLISGLHVDGFHFSDLETAWFSSLQDPEGLLPAPDHEEPPPISLFITTKQPRGFVHCLMRPLALPNEAVRLPYARGLVRRFVYQLPAIKVERHSWSDDHARPVIFAGAYRSIVSMRPHARPELLKEGSGCGVEVLRLCTYGARAEGYEKFATPRTTGYPAGEGGTGDAMEMEEEEESLAGALEEDLVKRSLRVPEIPNVVSWNMMEGTTAMAWDESVGKICVATTKDTGVQVLDFGGEAWEVAVVEEE